MRNPIWEALRTSHTGYAQRFEGMLRYPAEVLPFAAVEDAEAQVTDGLKVGEEVCFFGPVPRELPSGWEVAGEIPLVQMVARGVLAEQDGVEMVELSGEHAEEMAWLKAEAFPGYFGSETWRLGDYVGVRQDGRLVAMAGSRLALPGMREISAVCTHPAYTGRGYARALMARVAGRFGERGERAFLHTGARNARARGIYAAIGFETVGELGLTRVRRES